MYRKTRFMEELLAIREEMSRDCDYDVDLFAEQIRNGRRSAAAPPLRIKITTTDRIKKEQGHQDDRE